MIKPLFLFIFIALCNITYAQQKLDPGVLKKADEQVLFSFKLKSNNKIVTVCREKDNKYLVYRFGTADKMELQYPAVLNEASWKLFKYSGYSRGGGVQNEASELHSISFTNNGAVYQIYDDWNINEGTDAGILVKVGKKKTDIPGDVKTKTGTLAALKNYGRLIPNTYSPDE
ncbi:hypothetical protein KXD93_08105 [Mucilaginibacter sp. BJC16-A38]|uniref:hypothetical protein n=1 Tax=Mucilaginibacter phenanthrenivorans TaxID=1234842 RepID=UPI002157B53C|nr:hypothetical protein [Mucilaginibacter phenanthrenivorans]MCR8557601.1 hypothetical protein [Mucilaginibacter phenanthrenivorans]